MMSSLTCQQVSMAQEGSIRQRASMSGVAQNPDMFPSSPHNSIAVVVPAKCSCRAVDQDTSGHCVVAAGRLAAE